MSAPDHCAGTNPEGRLALLTKSTFERPIRDLNAAAVSTFPPETPQIQVLEQIRQAKIGVAAIGKASEIIGIVTERYFFTRLDFASDIFQDPIEKIMTPHPLFLQEENSVLEAMELMCFRNFRQVPILSKNEQNEAVVKVIVVKDLLKLAVGAFGDEVPALGTKNAALESDPTAEDEDSEFDVIVSDEANHTGVAIPIFYRPVRTVVSSGPLLFAPEETLDVVLDKMREGKFSAALIMKYGTKVVGIVTERDFITKVFGQISNLGSHTISEIMTKDPHSLMAHQKVAYAFNNMLTFGYRNILVTDNDQFPLAIIGQMDLLNYLYRKLNSVSGT